MVYEEISRLSLKVAEGDDEAAFQQLFLHFYPGLFSFAVAYMKDHELATEVVEDVLIHLWEQRKVLPAIKNLTYYLYVATKNGALNSLRKKRRNATVDLDEISSRDLQFHRNPEEILISEETLRDIEKAINSLPGKCQLIFRLIKEKGLKYKEVAELLGISIKTVETQMSLALHKIEQSLPQYVSGQRRSSTK